MFDPRINHLKKHIYRNMGLSRRYLKNVYNLQILRWFFHRCIMSKIIYGIPVYASNYVITKIDLILKHAANLSAKSLHLPVSADYEYKLMTLKTTDLSTLITKTDISWIGKVFSGLILNDIIYISVPNYSGRWINILFVKNIDCTRLKDHLWPEL